VLKLIFFDQERLLFHLHGKSTLISSSKVIKDLADFELEFVQVLFAAGVNVKKTISITTDSWTNCKGVSQTILSANLIFVSFS
jgi:hypothetical protein